jgi:hypothetical protein
MNPESIHQRALRPDGFSDAQLRIVARADARPGMTASIKPTLRA